MRKFLTSALICLFALCSEVNAQKKDDIKVAMAGYSFVKFDIDKTLEIMSRINVKYLCIKNFHLPFDSSDEQIAQFKAKLAENNVTGYAVGPIYMKSKQEVDDAFAYAKRVGVKLVVGVPNYDLLPYVSEVVKKYDMKLAIHLHGPDIKEYPDATDAWEHIKDLDPRMGICLDIGHDLRAGSDPVKDLIRYQSRIFDLHLKDVTAASREGRGIEVGRGLIDFPSLVKALRKVKYEGYCSLEYEKDKNDPFLGMAESIGYFKGIIDATE